ncbi:MAG: hypothetical protein IK057_02970 [Clostridia bacterium]|nr:hypothetical protein [Clostridia bacterium]
MILANLILNIFSNAIYSIGIKKSEKIHFWFFKKREKKWICAFCKKNDGSILLSGKFENFLKYQNPINDIFSFVLDSKISYLTENEFVDQVIIKFKSTYGNNLSTNDERIIRELFSSLLSHLKSYLEKMLGFDQRYLRYLNDQSFNRLNKDEEKSRNEFIKSFEAINNFKISDEKAEKFYGEINDILLDGHIDTVRSLVPVVENRNDSLENGIKICLEILSKYRLLTKDVLEAYSIIGSEKIKNDICRKLILHYIGNKDKLILLKEKTTNNDLKQIIETLITSKKLYTKTTKIENHIPHYTITVSKDYKNEQWLVNRICFLDIQENNNHFDGDTLLESGQTFIDKLFIYYAKHLKLISTYNEKDCSDINNFLQEIISLESVYSPSSNMIKTKYYEILLRLMYICSGKDTIEYAKGLSPEITSNTVISRMITLAKIKEKVVSEDDIIKFCYSSEQYDLIDCYFYVNQYDNYNIKKLLSHHETFIKKSILLFVRYVKAVCAVDGKEKAKLIVDQFEKEYKDFLEYHLLYLKFYEDNTKCHIESIYQKWQDNELKCQDLRFELEFARILLSNSYYDEAIEILSKLECLGYNHSILSKYTVDALFKLKKNVEGLNILLEDFDEVYQEDEQAIDAILAISFQTHRSVPTKIIDSALRIGSPRMLQLVAHIKYQEHKYDEAKDLIIKALLNSSDANNMCEAYIWFFSRLYSNDKEDFDDIDINRAVVLTTQKGDKKVYCVYKNGFLKKDSLIWEGAEHISEDTAISLDLLKRTVGSQVRLSDSLYTINKILPIDAYFFGICTDKMKNKGTLKVFQLDANETKNINIDRFKAWIKENLPSNGVLDIFIKKYKDFTQPPIPLYLIHRSSKCTYIETILSFINDKNTIFRDAISDDEDLRNNGYILSTSAIVALYKIGVDADRVSKNDVYVANSLVMQVELDAQKIIDENKQEHNISMGIVDEKLFFNELSSDEKRIKMTDAVGIKRFAKEFNSITNASDLAVKGVDNKTLQDGLGICDYDAIAIAINENRKLICAEAPVTGSASYLKQHTSCILDFLCEIMYPLVDLIECMNKMTDYKFLVIITHKTRNYIFDNFDKLNSEQQKAFLDRFNNYFENIEKQDAEYREICIPLINDVFFNENMQAHVGSPLTNLIIPHLLILNNLKIEIIASGDGAFELKLLKSPLEHPSITLEDTKTE